MNSIESILLSLEGKCRMDISAPASKEDITRVSRLYPKQFSAIKELYEISDGIEIDCSRNSFLSYKKDYFCK